MKQAEPGEPGAQKARADLLADALHGSYLARARWKRAYGEAFAERNAAYALLRECHGALWDACGSEDGLDCARGVPLMRRIEALFPDLEPIFDGEGE